MAKALMGHLQTQGRTSSQAENQRLRQRICDLEALVLRLQEHNDALLLDRAERALVDDLVTARAS